MRMGKKGRKRKAVPPAHAGAQKDKQKGMFLDYTSGYTCIISNIW